MIFRGIIVLLLSVSAAEAEVVGLPTGHLFWPLLADVKTPRFSISVLNADSPGRNTTVSAVSYGENYGLVRWPGQLTRQGWQLNLAGGIFAQFDMNTPSKDLVNADYTIGIPLSYRHNAFSARFRWYHQSSHLGDEFLINQQPERINLSYEAIEVLVAYDVSAWRVYGGAEYLYHRFPDELKSEVFHAGLEYRHPERAFKVGDIGKAHFVAGLDAKGLEQYHWNNAFSFKTGFEFNPARNVRVAGRHWSLLAEYYKGPSPYGQFFTENITYWGLSLSLAM